MEFYTNTNAVVTFNIDPESADGAIDVEVFDYNLVDPESGARGVSIETGIATVEGEVVSYTLDKSITQTPRELMLVATYEEDEVTREVTNMAFINVPYVELHEVRMDPAFDDYDDEELRRMERLVAAVINSYCNQSFDYELGTTKTALGKASDYLWLPRRLWSLDAVTVLDDSVRVLKDIEGNIISTDTTVREITDRVQFDYDNPWRLRNRRTMDYDPILVTRRRGLFSEGEIYAVRGNWGYEFVPRGVRLATRILMETYFAEDSVYRDRYIDNIRAGNWRMEFRVTGDETTGSANADMILSGFKNINAAVI
jgi:hypothetical protein